ncbi:hypothetical protein [Amycolatopsis sp. TNS106]|uniref:hypothetical protein n=1 Tax=Amycolatopsis sp. TNS106 TaxID=2861750 RepID=UPI001C56322A|nr:hypothetical protein [Amycolatopsis sp. TNS106]QXV57500.1 hypothetical protein CVV72_11175 [Amycolatopsis sp. TNS106]
MGSAQLGVDTHQNLDKNAPFVYAERELHKTEFRVYFEDLATRTAATGPREVYRALQLGSRPPAD